MRKLSKSDEIALIFPLLNGDLDEQIKAIGPIVKPQPVVDRMKWALDVCFSSTAEFEVELRKREPHSSFLPTLLAVLATKDPVTFEIWETLEKAIAYKKVNAFAARMSAITKHYDISLKKRRKPYDKEYKFPHHNEWTETKSEWLPSHLASSAFDGGHAKRINFNGVVHNDAIYAARTVTATYLERSNLKDEQEGETKRLRLGM
jgi:hypothetical protein